MYTEDRDTLLVLTLSFGFVASGIVAVTLPPVETAFLPDLAVAAALHDLVVVAVFVVVVAGEAVVVALVADAAAPQKRGAFTWSMRTWL